MKISKPEISDHERIEEIKRKCYAVIAYAKESIDKASEVIDACEAIEKRKKLSNRELMNYEASAN